ncbi:MAG: hypothetical protein A2Y14_00495 [Verrucomicrobia bacterium GWF2_51_19]|nr:MAG: hypothetical protein A2Y14_00495 [Verrucomicrobia bacterium GWF2_51_19]HCJ11865.1 hypothetical protein [Opitutae bacterium]
MKHKLENNQLSIFVEEDLLSTNVQEIRAHLEAAFSELKANAHVIVDITKCKIIDSQGLNLLIGLYKESTKKSASFKVIGCSPANLRLFSIFKLKERFGITE